MTFLALILCCSLSHEPRDRTAQIDLQVGFQRISVGLTEWEARATLEMVSDYLIRVSREGKVPQLEFRWKTKAPNPNDNIIYDSEWCLVYLWDEDVVRLRDEIAFRLTRIGEPKHPSAFFK